MPNAGRSSLPPSLPQPCVPGPGEGGGGAGGGRLDQVHMYPSLPWAPPSSPGPITCLGLLLPPISATRTGTLLHYRGARGNPPRLVPFTLDLCLPPSPRAAWPRGRVGMLLSWPRPLPEEASIYLLAFCLHPGIDPLPSPPGWGVLGGGAQGLCDPPLPSSSKPPVRI